MTGAQCVCGGPADRSPHAEIQQHDCGHMLQNMFRRIGRSVNGIGLIVLVRQRLGHGVRRVPVVIDNQNPFRCAVTPGNFRHASTACSLESENGPTRRRLAQR